MKRLHLVLALLTILTIPIVAWGVGGNLGPGMGAPFGQFSWTAPVVVDTATSSVPIFLQCIVFTMSDSAPQAGTITLYDNTAESGTVILAHTFTTAVFMPVQICPQTQTTVGLYIGYSATVDVNTSVSYRK